MNKISIIVPCYNEDAALPIYYKEMCKIMAQMKEEEFELIFVDDGSTDHTLAEMKILHEKDERCQYFSFSRNFGKEAAIYAGLKNATGEYAAIMDVDLQDPPSLLPKMYEILQTEIMTVWQRGVLQEVESRRSVPFYLKAFTNLLTVFPKQRL